MQTALNVNILLRFRPFVSDSLYRWYLDRNKGFSPAASVIGPKIIRFTMRTATVRVCIHVCLHICMRPDNGKQEIRLFILCLTEPASWDILLANKMCALSCFIYFCFHLLTPHRPISITLKLSKNIGIRFNVYKLIIKR